MRSVRLASYSSRRYDGGGGTNGVREEGGGLVLGFCVIGTYLRRLCNGKPAAAAP